MLARGYYKGFLDLVGIGGARDFGMGGYFKITS